MVQIGLGSPKYNFQTYRPINVPLPLIVSAQGDIQGGIPKNQLYQNRAKMAIYGHLAIGPYATNMGKWGIPEKSITNVAQRH